MENIKALFIVLIAIVSTLLLSSYDKDKEAKGLDVVTVVSDDINVINANVKAYSKYGYKIVCITPQSVSTSVNSNGYHLYTYTKPYRDIKGDLILVMQK